MGICCSRRALPPPRSSPRPSLEEIRRSLELSRSMRIAEDEARDLFAASPRATAPHQSPPHSVESALERAPSNTESLPSIAEEADEQGMIEAIMAGRKFRNDAHREAYLHYLRRGDPGSTPSVGLMPLALSARLSRSRSRLDPLPSSGSDSSRHSPG